MIKKEIIDFSDLNVFSDLIKDYKSKKKEISQFISSFPTEEAIIKQIRKKKLSKEIRLDLVKSLKKQYKKTEFINSDLKKINYNIDSLISENTFTITAGHQLNLFSNPLFAESWWQSAFSVLTNIIVQFYHCWGTRTEVQHFAEHLFLQASSSST